MPRGARGQSLLGATADPASERFLSGPSPPPAARPATVAPASELPGQRAPPGVTDAPMVSTSWLTACGW